MVDWFIGLINFFFFRSLKAGDEILDNYGYHYAVMSREERQRKLYNQ